MNGRSLSRAYYEECAQDILRKKFPDVFGRMTVGLVGEGSDCFGYDDEFSRDEDFGPAFAIWLDGPDFLKYGQFIQKVYDELPQEFEGYKKGKTSIREQDNAGVICTPTWYRKYTGYNKGPRHLEQWLRVGDFSLAAATNGEIFKEGEHSSFMEVRHHLLKGFPEDIRLKRMALRVVMMGQAGQKNYMRCFNRGDHVTASMALAEFTRAGLSLVYLLNHAYAPYYKWLYRGIEGMKVMPRAYDLFGRLAKARPGQETQEMIERICALTVAELKRQGLTDLDSPYIESHCTELLDRIVDQTIRNLPLSIR